MNRAERRQGTAPTRAELKARAGRRRVIIYTSLALVVIAAVVAIGYASRIPKTASDAPAVAQIKIGQQAPQFDVSTTAGPFDLAKNGSKPTLLEVFASWCPHCQREVKVINPLYTAFGDKVNFVAVSGSQYGIDGQSAETQADVVNWVTRFGARYPVAFDGQLDVANKYLQGGFPTLVLIGRDNAILAIGTSEIPGAKLKAALQAVIAGKPVNPSFG